MRKTFLCLWLLVSVMCEFDREVAKEMVQLSEAAYSKMSELSTWKCSFCLSTLKDSYYVSNTANQLQGFVAYSTIQNKIVVVFRGTAFLKNWLKNFKVDLVEYNYPNCTKCKVHRGFKSSSQLLFQEIVKSVKNLRQKYGDIQVMLAGHSLGGALAILVGAHLKRTLGVVVNIYTFGAPRVGNKAFAEYCSSIFKQNYRVVNYNDAVVHLPSKNLQYRHSDTEIWYNSKANRFESCVGDASKRCSNSVKWMDLKSSAHYCRKYVRLMKQISVQAPVQPKKTANLRTSGPMIEENNNDEKAASNVKQSSPVDKDEKEGKYRSSLTGIEGYQLYTFMRQYQSENEVGEFAN